MTPHEFAIGELGARTKTNVETIRYYERIGLLPKPARAANGRRVYDEKGARRLSFIRRCRNLGFTIDEVKGLAALVFDDSYTCEEIRLRTVIHLDVVRAKIAELQSLKRALTALAASCEGGASRDCAIVDALTRTN